MPAITASARDQIIADAKTLPGLIAAAQASDPALADAILGRATSATKTQGGAAVAGVVTWIAARYGFGWDAGTDEIVAGLITLGAGLAIHWAQVRLHLANLQGPFQPPNTSASVS